MRTTITANAAPPQQFTGRDITITGTFTADGAGIANALIKLYRDVDGVWTSVSQMTTSVSGGFAFQAQQASPGTSRYKAAYPGDAAYEPSESAEMALTYVTKPTTTPTATATSQQQVVGHDVTISGTLTADGTPVAEDDAPKGRTPLMRTTITANAAPPQQFTGRDVTITGTLTANGAGIANALIKLYRDVDGLWTSVGQMTTNQSGGFAFQAQQASPGTSRYKAAYPGGAAYEPSVSAEMAVKFVTIPTTITGTASPPQQFIGRDVTISGRLTADGTPVAEAFVTLYNADDVAEPLVPVATVTTNAAGDYQFILTDTVPGHHTYGVRSSGAAAYEPASSGEIVVTYVTTPTTITATASPRQQVIGRDVAVTGTLTADGTPVAAAPVTLYNADDVIELVPVSTVTTDAAGDYRFALTDTVPGHHTYVVRSPGTAAYEPSASAKMVVTYVTIPATITATAAPPHQFTGRDVTITGRLTAEGAGLAAVPLTLYKTDAAEDFHVAAATTDDEGFFQFALTDTVPGHHTYVVRSPGTAAYEPSMSAEMVVTYVTIPATITATADSRQQVVGRDVIITGRLTAEGAGLAAVPLTLYEMDAAERVPVGAATTDAEGYYLFTVSETAASTHVFRACTEGDSTYGPGCSTELLVTYKAPSAEVQAVEAQAVEAQAVEARRGPNLGWLQRIRNLLHRRR
jgi:5-hydroxyisourate hydrolase-like protein (transthyretin family)